MARWEFDFINPVFELIPDSIPERLMASIAYFWYGFDILVTNFVIKKGIEGHSFYELKEIVISLGIYVVVAYFIETLEKGMGIAYFIISITFLLKHYGKLKSKK